MRGRGGGPGADALPRRSAGKWGIALGLLVAAAAAAAVLWQAGGRAAAPPLPIPVVGIRVGDLAPQFRLVDVQRRVVTRSSLVADRPGLIFFTATWCFPCVEGLRQLTRYQRDLGGAPFNVLVVFVDPQETEDDIRAYRQRWRFPQTWHYALDRDDLVRRYAIRYLDTKFVLDRNGVIRYTDFYPASYTTWVRALATVGISP